MPITNAIGAYNVGRDCTVVLMGPYGRVQLDNVTGFNADQVTTNLKLDRLDGVQLTAELPKGWTGSFDLDRGSPALDQLFSAIEAAWYLNGTVISSTVYQYIQETDGSTTTWQYTQASLKLSKAGEWRSDATVKQTIQFEAFRRQAV